MSEYRVIQCVECEERVVLHNPWACECEGCGTEYNGMGQRLAPRSEWGWETGEDF